MQIRKQTRCLSKFVALNHRAILAGVLLLFFTGPVLASIVINEIMQNPSAVSDASGEWFELYNPDGLDVDINGWTIRDDGIDSHVISNGGPLIVPAGGFLVLGNNPDVATNGGVSVAYAYPSSFALANGADELVLVDGSASEIDRVNWDGGPVFPDPTGASMSLADPALDNNVGGNWCTSTTPFGLGDLGTPGAVNFCEIVDEPPTVSNTTPADGSTGIALDANIVISFSEDVTVTDPWFEIHCGSSGSHNAVVSGGPQNFTLDPATDFVLGESCNVDVFAAQVADQDGAADNMAADYAFGFDTNPVAVAELVINEIDYDQPGTDAAEFIEILNKGATPVDLAGFSLVLVNGNNNSIYKTIDLPSFVLPAGGYYVVCGDAGNVYNCDLDVSPDTNLVQNGSPDGVALYAGATLLDTVSYEGDLAAPYTETSGAGLEDSSSAPYLGISRTPDGTDTGVNNVDFSARCITPGFANSLENTGCVDPTPPPLRINEIDYDQPGTDAAEFVEIINAGNSPADLEGVSLVLVNGNGDTVYQTFALPAVMLGAGDYFVVCGNAANVFNCDLDVSPDSNLIQNGAPDAVALTRAGVVLDTVSYEGDVGAPFTEGSGSGLNDSGSTGQDNLGISRFPNGNDTDRNNVDLVYACITPGLANTSLDSGCSATGPLREIHEIQGSGSASPFAGQGLTTMDNIVTAVGTDGFFMQTPDARADGDVNTSNGIFVFTGAAPAVAVGDQVNVSGSVVEFFDFTEFAGGSSVIVTSSGNALPTATVFDDSVPSPDPMAPSCAIEFECYEGMLVQITGGTVTGPNQFFGSDPVAEVYITAAGTRTFREPGIEFPGLFGYPEWDGNPEVFELDPDKLGLPNQVIPAGSTFDATGALGYEFGGYELWPSTLNVTPAPLPVPVRAREDAEMTVGALNLYRLFDDIDDAPIEVRDPDTDALLTVTDDEVLDSAEYASRLAKFSAYIRGVLDSPDILAVSEVESLKVLQDLADTIAADDGAVNYTPYLEEGNDVGGIDVGFLVRDSVVVDKVTQLGRFELLSVDDSLLNDRPPLLLEGRQVADGSDFPIAVMAIHGRSLSSIESSDRVRQKRLEQSQYVAMQVQAVQDADPDVNLVLAGDFNAYEFSDGYVDVTGFMKGSFTAADNLVCETNPCTDHVSPDLIDQVLMIDAGERYSFIFGGSAQTLDHALTSSGLDELVRDFQFGRGNSDAAVGLIDDGSTPLRSSDHDGLVLFLAKDSDGDGVTDDADHCPGTVIPESVPTETLGSNRFALTDDDRVFDTSNPNGAGPGASFDIFDTGGCSCEQIVVEQDLGKGHLKFGCSLGEMEDWVGLINLP